MDLQINRTLPEISFETIDELEGSSITGPELIEIFIDEQPQLAEYVKHKLFEGLSDDKKALAIPRTLAVMALFNEFLHSEILVEAEELEWDMIEEAQARQEFIEGLPKASFLQRVSSALGYIFRPSLYA